MARNADYIISLQDKFSPVMNNIQKKTSSLGQTFGKFAKLAGGVFAAGMVVNAGKEAISTFANFEAQMSTVRAITSATGTEFESLTNMAKEMGRTTAFTATEASEAMTFLGMAGFNTTQIMESLPDVLNLAAAGSVGLGEAADIASNILTGMGMSASETGRVIDVMAKTATSSNTNITEMGEAFKQIAPSLASLNVGIEEGGALISLLANAGIKGTDATTALNTSIARLTGKIPMARKEMERLNLNAFDAQGNFVGFEEVIRRFNKATVGMSQKQKLLSTQLIFGAHANKQWTSLFNASKETIVDGEKVVLKGADAFAYYTNELKNAQGTAEEMAKIKLDNLKGSFTILKSAIEGATIELVSKFAPTLRKIVDRATVLVGKFTSNLGNIGKVLAPISKIFNIIFTEVRSVFAELQIEASKTFSLISPMFEGAGSVIEDTILPAVRMLVKTFLRLQAVGIKIAIKILPAIVKIGQAIGKLFQAIGKFVNIVQSVFIRVLESLGVKLDENTSFLDTFVNIIVWTAKIIGSSLERIINFVTKGIEYTTQFISWIVKMFDKVKQFTENNKIAKFFLEQFLAPINFVIGAIRGFFKFLSKIIDQFNAKMGKAVKSKKLADILRNAQGTKEGEGTGTGTENLTGLGITSVIPTTGTTGTGGVTTGITGVKAAAPKNFTINIDKLIEDFTVSTETMTEGATAIREKVKNVILEALNDVTQLSEGL